MYIDFNKFQFTKINVLNLLIFAIPLSLIIGNLAVNINITLIILLGFYTYGKKTFQINEKNIQFLLYFFFIYLIIITFFNNFPLIYKNILYKENLLKSLFYLRFLLFYFVINKIINEKQLNLKYLIYSFIFFTTLISVDLIFQLIFGKNLIGLKSDGYKLSGFFGEEKIAGGYLQKFSLFVIFYFLIKIKKNFIREVLILILIFLLFFLITLSGNRMPAVLFVFSIILYLLIKKKFKLILFTLASVSLVIYISLFYPLLKRSSDTIYDFYNKSKQIIILSPKLFYYDDYPDQSLRLRKNTYLAHFNTAAQLWKKNKIFGSGLKSFKINSSFGRNLTQNNHPHNYFLEILLDMGIIGIFIIYSIVFLGLKKFYYFNKKNYFNKNLPLLMPFFLITFIEFFPFRSSGSFFSTSNSVIIFFFLALFLNINKLLPRAKNYNM